MQPRPNPSTPADLPKRAVRMGPCRKGWRAGPKACRLSVTHTVVKARGPGLSGCERGSHSQAATDAGHCC